MESNNRKVEHIPDVSKMRAQYLTLLLPLTISALQLSPVFAPFYEAVIATNDTANASHDLLKRDGNCPTNYNSCSTLAAADAGACCISGSTCTTDGARIIACCPTGAKCTGLVPYPSAVVVGTTGTGGAVLGGGGSATTTTTTTPSTSTAAATATITSAPSYVDNIYFPFPYIPTTYVNSASCMIAYSACQSNYAACTADLGGGGGFAVTIVAPNGGGVTVSPTVQNLGTASANSICSSLSNVGCYGIVSSNCNAFATATGFATGTATNGGMGSRITGGCYAGVVVGVGAGIVGMM